MFYHYYLIYCILLQKQYFAIISNSFEPKNDLFNETTNYWYFKLIILIFLLDINGNINL